MRRKAKDKAIFVYCDTLAQRDEIKRHANLVGQSVSEFCLNAAVTAIEAHKKHQQTLASMGEGVER